VAHKEMPLTLLVQFADSWTAHVQEERREIKEDVSYYDKKN
jgi:hypothetical protein